MKVPISKRHQNLKITNLDITNSLQNFDITKEYKVPISKRLYNSELLYDKFPPKP